MDIETKVKELMPTNILPSTRRMIVIGLSCVAVADVIGMSFGKVPIESGMLLAVSITSGFLGLLKGGN